jgi:transcriptional regulator with XRE-family HTH domain
MSVGLLVYGLLWWFGGILCVGIDREVHVSGSRRRAGNSATAARMLVGAQLRWLREERGLTRAEAGDPIRASESKISRMELGRVSFKERDVADLLTLYGVQDEQEREALLARVREANARDWWQPYADVAPNWFQRYLGLEATATLIRTYELQFVPGLLQTEDYARAVVRLGFGRAHEEEMEVERRVQLRLQRQQVLTRPNPPKLWAVVDEAALRRCIGSYRVMRDQIEALISLVTKLPNLRLQIAPFSAGGHVAAGGSFVLLRFPQEDLSDLVYIEQLTNALYLERQADVDHYFDVVNQLFLQAAPLTETASAAHRDSEDSATH